MNQMREQEEAKRRSYVEMSPHEAAVNQTVLSKFEGMMKLTQKEETQ